MLNEVLARRFGAIIITAIALLPAACNNTYGPPPNGTPQNWGQQHYLDVEKQRQQNLMRMNN
jgi:hypothetical protein